MAFVPPIGNPQSQQPTINTSRLQHRVSLFIYAKLMLILGASVACLTVFGPRWERIAALAALLIIDCLLLIPYRKWILLKPQTAPLATTASIALSSVIITFALYLLSDLVSPGVLAYFILLPLACLVVPEMRMALSSAGISVVAYLVLAILLAIGWAPALKPRPASLDGWPLPAFLLVPALLAAAFLTGRIFAMLEGRSFERERQYEETRRRAEAEEIWDTIGRTLISTQDLDQVLTTVIQVINEKMRVEKAWVLLLGPTKDELRCAESSPKTAAQLPPPRLPLGEGIPGWVVSSGKAALVSDVNQDTRWNPNYDSANEVTTRSVLCVPLVAKETVIGAIELVNKLEDNFTQEDLRLLESIAAPVAIAIQNAQLHRQVQQQLDEVTKLFGLVERAKQEWETSVDAIEEGIILIDRNRRLLRANRTVANWLRMQPAALIGQQCQAVVHGTDPFPSDCPYMRVLDSSEHLSEAQVEYPHMDGIFRCVAYPLRESRGGLAGAVVVLKNITEEKRLQAHLIQSEKLAATGRMAASLAHEINNPLQAIQGCLDLAQANPADLQKQERYLTMAKSEVDRLATIVQRMLDFYRPSGGAKTVLNARELVEDVLVFSYKRLQHGKVTARVEWEATSSIIAGNANQLKQVFLNVILNAVDAMPGGGELVIRGQTIDSDGLWLAIDFVDSGTGIPPEQLDKIFEPFYTTKTTGTGLGLGISHSIVVGHGGRLTVSSIVGEGTTFTVWLPVHSLEPIETPSPTDDGLQSGEDISSGSRKTPMSNAECILVVDDEKAIRVVVADALEGQGYQVEAVGGSPEALDACERVAFDLALVDLKLPGPMDGLELLKELRRRYPSMIVIVLTGYGSLDSAIAAMREGAYDYLTKPASMALIVASVRRGLSKRQEKAHQEQLITHLEETLRQLKRESRIEPASDLPEPDRFVQTPRVVIDRQKRLVVLDDQLIELTPTEFDLLDYLATHSDHVVTASELIHAAQGYDLADADARPIVRVHLQRLRRKLGDDPKEPCIIQNVRGRGYRFVA